MKELWLRMQNSARLEKILKISTYFLIFLYVFSLPSWSSRGGWQYVSYGIMALLIVASGLYTFLYARSNLAFRPMMLLMPAFALWALLGTIGYSHEFRRWFTLILLVITFFTLYYSFRIVSSTRIIFNMILWALFAFCIYFIIHYWNDILNYRSISDFRLGSYFDDVNAIGCYCSFGTGLSLYFLLYGQKMSKKMMVLYYVCYFIAFIIFALIGASTGSRAFLVDIILIILIFIFLKLRKKPWLAALVVLGIIGVGVGALFLPFMTTLRERTFSMISAIFGTGTDFSTTQRTTWQICGFILGSQRLLIGYGPNGFSIASGIGTYAHANFAEVFCDFGLVGACLFYFFILYLAYRLFKAKSDESLCLLGLVITMLLVNSFLCVYCYSKWIYMFFALCAYLAFQEKENKESEIEIASLTA